MPKVIASAVTILMAAAALATAQNTAQSTTASRRLIQRAAPLCPELARKMQIQGTVKLEAIVKPNASLRITRVMGGNRRRCCGPVEI